MLNHGWIAARIPHQGSMCLLDRVSAWSTSEIICIATGHTDTAHPLRRQGRLGSVSGIEYAAQTTAVHGALLADYQEEASARHGYLTSVRGVRQYVSRLDQCRGELHIRAERLAGNDNHILYQFEIHHGESLLMEGRISVVLDAGRLSGTQT